MFAQKSREPHPCRKIPSHQQRPRKSGSRKFHYDRARETPFAEVGLACSSHSVDVHFAVLLAWIAADSETLAILDLRSLEVTEVPHSRGLFSPRWSPDGKFLAAVRLESQQLEIYNFQSQQWNVFTEISAGYPNWSGDGKHVYFFSKSGGRRSVYRVSVSTRQIAEVTSLEPIQQGPYFMGTWIGLAPDDSPLAVRNLTTEDVYAWDFVKK